MGSNVNLGSFEVTEATVSRSVSRSDKKVTMDTFACLPEANMLAPLILPFDIV